MAEALFILRTCLNVSQFCFSPSDADSQKVHQCNVSIIDYISSVLENLRATQSLKNVLTIQDTNSVKVAMDTAFERCCCSLSSRRKRGSSQ